ncbi:fibronectin type III domain-containing protein [Sporolactobacillus terrae]|uniref:Fibronectin type-III domain-containing protein n=1 Tax=Sporolactobacillus terrae TaxID=269673 RepID=A0A5K7WY23_9BACL|nr:fibronectin type III domain-containing protein [Sporolactobacillus terrae]BBN97498.1 hypothetical protein St703_02030 [Sporolactobacillus terrae]
MAAIDEIKAQINERKQYNLGRDGTQNKRNEELDTVSRFIDEESPETVADITGKIDGLIDNDLHQFGATSGRIDELERLKKFAENTVIVPGKPSVTVTAGDGVLHATAALPEDNGGSLVTAVKFFIKLASEGTWPTEPAATQAPSDLTYDFLGLTNGTEYSTAVVVENEIGDSEMSDSAHGTPTAPAG